MRRRRSRWDMLVFECAGDGRRIGSYSARGDCFDSLDRHLGV